MDLLTPNFGLIVWQIVVFINLLGVIFAIVQLYRHQLSFQIKTLWCLIILAIPLGWVIYLVFGRQMHRTKAVR